VNLAPLPIAPPRQGGLSVASLAQARKHKRGFDAVLTIEDPACRPAQRLRFHRQPAPHHLVLGFEDVDDDRLGVVVATETQVRTALEFSRAHAQGSLLIHCYHGLGRSTAVALAVLADRSGPGCEESSLQELLQQRPNATPNLVVVKLADAILGRAGALISVVASWEAQSPDAVRRRSERLAFLRDNPDLYSWLPR
jgi:predicted protein tyrosine phosphatase